MRTIVISDCHAQPWLIENALNHARYDKSVDRLIFAGDFLDIGEYPHESLQLLLDNDAEILFGNHEHAIVMRQVVHPQSNISWSFREELISRLTTGEWGVAALVDDAIVVSHAGFSQVYQGRINEIPISAFIDEINEEFVEDAKLVLQRVKKFSDFDDSMGPLWFRPDLMTPVPGITQVVGHTPPEILLGEFRNKSGYYSVDPFARWEFDERRYRYALIEDGKLQIIDSLHFMQVGRGLRQMVDR